MARGDSTEIGRDKVIEGCTAILKSLDFIVRAKDVVVSALPQKSARGKMGSEI